MNKTVRERRSRTRWLAVLAILTLPLVSFDGHAVQLGSAAYAGGDGGGGNANDTAPKTNQAKPDKTPAFVPNTDDLRATKGPQTRMHDKLEGYAKKDGLAGLATSLDRLKKFRKAHERLVERAKTTKQKTEANNILSQLQRYRKQNKNKALKANANRILKALVALDAHDRVVAAEKAFYKAKLTTKGIGDDIEAQVDYEDAVKDYNDALKNVPAVPRNQFERFEKTLKVD